MTEKTDDALAGELTERVASGEHLLAAMRDVCVRHAQRIRELGPVRSLALDPCPQCGGNVIATDVVARCAAGCGWTHRATQRSALLDRVSQYTTAGPAKTW